MCGIAGVVSKGNIDTELFEKMTDIIAHRGPDDRGIWSDEGISLGHRRLSIIDLSMAAHQPYIFKDRYVLIFNGEIYNYIELRQELTDIGITFHTESDTEVLAASYAVWGQECVEHFNGMWAFAIFDRDEQILFCSRDRYGVKPFYYCITPEGMIFGSEIKQILLMRDTDVHSNMRKVYEYLINGKIDRSEDTMFEGILQLMPGHNIVYDLKDHTYLIKEYYDVYRVIAGRNNKMGYRRAAGRFLDCYKDAVSLRLRSDVRLGFCLSGGLDSSANVCLAKAVQNDIRQETVTHCSSYAEYDEWDYADKVIRQVDATSHKVYSDAENLLKDMDRFVWHNDEPFGSSAVYASWSVFKEANEQGLKVMIDGQGADELLAGYTDYFPVYFTNLIKKKRFFTFLYEVLAYYARRKSSGDYWSKNEMIFEPIRRAFRSGRVYNDTSSNSGAVNRRSPFTEEQLNGVIKDNSIGVDTDMEEFKKEDFRTILGLLHCEDRMTMAHSIESRLPFLDYRMVDLLGGLPMSYRIRHGMTKAVMRKALIGVIPDTVRTRIVKLGFTTPEDRWINDNPKLFDEEVRGSVRMLADHGVLDYEHAIEWWDSVKNDLKRGNRMPWRIICAAHWMKVFDIKPVREQS